MGTVTIDGNPYDVYGDLAAANLYLLGRAAYRALWQEATAITAARETAMVQAKDLLDRQKWKGTTTLAYPAPQKIQWPRDNATDGEGTAVPNGTTPQQILDASYELAAILYADPDGLRQDTANVNIQSAQAGTAKVTFFGRQLVGRFPRDITELIGGYLIGGSTTGLGVGEAFGADGESEFDPDDDFEVV